MHPFRVLRLWLGLLAVTILSAGAAAVPVTTESLYQTPPQVLVDIIDAPPTPLTRLDPKREWLLLLERPSLAPVSELAERELRLAGLRIRPQTHGPSRSSYLSGLKLVRISDLVERRIVGLPEGARLQNILWSPDGSHIAFTNNRPDAIELWVAEVASGQAHRLMESGLNLAAGTSPLWLDDRTLVCTLVPAGQDPEPAANPVPRGPVIQQNSGQSAPARTYQDLLKNADDDALFEHYVTSQVAKITVQGQITPIGPPGLFLEVSPSPDGRYLLVQKVHRPFSYLVPVLRFPRQIEIWDLNGNAVRTVADLPLQEEISMAFNSVPTGPREVAWRNDAAATLFWVEALDGGDASKDAAERDRLFLLPAPFRGDPTPLTTLRLRFQTVTWGNDGLALVDEAWRKTRRARTWIVRPGAGEKSSPDLLFDRSSEDRYNDPGFPLLTVNARGRQVLRMTAGDRGFFFLGEGASPEGDRPFLDAVDPVTKTTQRLFRSTAPYYEFPADLLDSEGRFLLVRRESADEPPNFFVRDLKTAKLRQLTHYPDPAPQLRGVHKEMIRYARQDGVQLSATLYTPPGWKSADGPLPTIFWIYPQEFKSADAAGQVNDSPYRFVRILVGSPLLWLTQGYAVLDNPSLPIIGEGDKEPNDTYIQQLVSSASAAVDELVRRGVADRRRIAISGHSYGAFTTANLLAHSDLFAAGIAESGAYNRTLTPFGFQSEERSIWKAPETYIALSPFMFADKVNEPLLLFHGQADSNSGTDPLQSERFFAALKGNGATARLVMLPFESHLYRGRESVLHVLWETYNWLETYVKNR